MIEDPKPPQKAAWRLRLDRLGADRLVRMVVLGGMTSVGLRTFGLVLGLVAHILLSNALGAGGYGLYAIAIGWSMLITVPAKAGLDLTVLRFAPVYVENNQNSHLKGLLWAVAQTLALTAIAAAVFIFTVTWFFPGAIGANTLTEAAWLALLVAAISFLSVFSSFFRAVRKLFYSQFFEQVFRLALLIALLAAALLFAWRLEIESALAFTALSAVGTFAVMMIFFRSQILQKHGTNDAPVFERSAWFSLGWPVLLIALVQQANSQLSVILLGWLSEPVEAGLFAAANRLSTLVTMALAAMSVVAVPMISAAFARNDRAELARLARISARLSLVFALSVSLAMAAVGPLLLRLFGDGFDAAYLPLLVLLFGAVVNAAAGLVSAYLMMTGEQNYALYFFLASFVAGLIAGVPLIHYFGGFGAALAALLSVTLVNVLQVWFVRRRLGYDTTVIGLPPIEKPSSSERA
jgi:O-antigen/teichoic acid export membrane protein